MPRAIPEDSANAAKAARRCVVADGNRRTFRAEIRLHPGRSNERAMTKAVPSFDKYLWKSRKSGVAGRSVISRSRHTRCFLLSRNRIVLTVKRRRRLDRRIVASIRVNLADTSIKFHGFIISYENLIYVDYCVKIIMYADVKCKMNLRNINIFVKKLLSAKFIQI